MIFVPPGAPECIAAPCWHAELGGAARRPAVPPVAHASSSAPKDASSPSCPPHPLPLRPGYSFGQSMFDVSVVKAGSPWGAATFAAPDGSRRPTEVELAYAKHQARRAGWLSFCFLGRGRRHGYTAHACGCKAGWQRSRGGGGMCPRWKVCPPDFHRPQAQPPDIGVERLNADSLCAPLPSLLTGHILCRSGEEAGSQVSQASAGACCQQCSGSCLPRGWGLAAAAPPDVLPFLTRPHCTRRCCHRDPSSKL